MKKISTKRYTQLAEREIWNEMIAEENVAMNRTDLPDVQQVMNIMMHRIKFNLQYIYNALQQYGFKFTDFGEPPQPTKPLIFEQNDVSQQLFSLEDEYSAFGFFPLSILEFYKHIREIDFRGFFPNQRTNILLDAIMIVPMKELIENDLGDEEQGVFLASDAFFKENISGGGYYGIELTPNQQIDARLKGFFTEQEAEEAPMFIDYLRLCFKWAGFPGLEFANRNEVDDYIWDVVSNIVPYLKPI